MASFEFLQWFIVKLKNVSMGKKFIPTMAIACMLAACSDDAERANAGGVPILKNLLVEIAPYDPETGMAGDFDFVTGSSSNKLYYEFGAVVTGHDGEKVLPTFEFRVKAASKVLSPINGQVNRLAYQDETDDYEIILASGPHSDIFVVVDHVKSVRVSEGNNVTAGMPIGVVGNFSGGLGRVELMVADSDRSYCPFAYFDPELLVQYRAKLAKLMEDWESFKADESIYNQELMVEIGCTSASYPQ